MRWCKEMSRFQVGIESPPLGKHSPNLAVACASPFPVKLQHFLGRKPFPLEKAGLLLSKRHGKYFGLREVSWKK